MSVDSDDYGVHDYSAIVSYHPSFVIFLAWSIDNNMLLQRNYNVKY